MRGSYPLQKDINCHHVNMSESNLTTTGKCQVVHCSVAINDTIHADDLVTFDVFYWTCTVFVFLYGAPLTLGIVHYERYAGDPQKRSLANRFVSKGLVSCFLSALAMESFVGSLR